MNRSSIKVTLSTADRRPIEDRVVFKLYNQQLSSENQRFEVDVRRGAVTLAKVPAFPNGLAELFIAPERYRTKSIFVDVPAGEPRLVSETLFVDPDEAEPTFPTWTDLQSTDRWGGLRRFLRASGFASAAAWKSLEGLAKAGLLNIYAKMQKDKADGKPDLLPLIERVERPRDVRQDRIFALVQPALLALLRAAPSTYQPVSGALHPFDPPWTPVVDGSFKTRDAAGNLQLTFAAHPDGRMLADIDLDDHAGIAHAADVLRHRITGKKTHPYDIHQILNYFQSCDPGYSLA
jgi:hypothetical protein